MGSDHRRLAGELRDSIYAAMACAWIVAIDDDATGRGVLGSDNTHFSNPSNRPC